MIGWRRTDSLSLNNSALKCTAAFASASNSNITVMMPESFAESGFELRLVVHRPRRDIGNIDSYARASQQNESWIVQQSCPQETKRPFEVEIHFRSTLTTKETEKNLQTLCTGTIAQAAYWRTYHQGQAVAFFLATT
jgi:hypothetical protein